MNAYTEFLAVENSPMHTEAAEPIAVDWTAVAWSIASNVLAAARGVAPIPVAKTGRTE